jgi:hypothetical protein
LVYLRTLVVLGLQPSVEERKKLYKLIDRAFTRSKKPARVEVSPVLELKLDEVTREIMSKLERFEAWKEKVVIDKDILGGEPSLRESSGRTLFRWRLRGFVRPRVEDRGAERLEVGYVARHDRHPVRQRGRGDERIPVGPRVRHVELRTRAGHGSVDRQHAVGKCGQYVVGEPSA